MSLSLTCIVRGFFVLVRIPISKDLLVHSLKQPTCLLLNNTLSKVPLQLLAARARLYLFAPFPVSFNPWIPPHHQRFARRSACTTTPQTSSASCILVLRNPMSTRRTKSWRSRHTVHRSWMKPTCPRASSPGTRIPRAVAWTTRQARRSRFG
jgi:hypothetical protein